MQTPAVSTLSLSTKSVAAESLAGVGSCVVAAAGTESAFAEVFLGQAAGISGQAAAAIGAAKPQTIASDHSTIAQPGDFDPAVVLLPLPAATGKILPLPGKGEADGEAVEPMPAVTAPLVAAYVTTPIALAVPFAKPGIGNPLEETTPDCILCDREILDLALDPALGPVALVLPQTLTLPEATALTGTSVLTKTDAPSSPMSSSLAPAKLDAAPQPNATVAVPQAPNPSAPLAPTASATSIAGQIAVSIAATPVAAAVPTEQVVKVMTSDEGAGHPAGPIPATAQLAMRAAAANAGSGETSQRGAREDAPRRDGAVGVAAPVVSAGNMSAADLLPGVSASPTVAADRAIASPLPAVSHVIPDRAEAIASVVDRLMAAREVGLGALASIAIENRDFGDLTVSFSDKGNSLEVSVTAADADKQRALTAALATTERPVTREPATQATQASSNGASTAMQQDRSAEGQLARDGGGRQPRGEAVTEQHRVGQSPATATETETAVPQRSGIYV